MFIVKILQSPEFKSRNCEDFGLNFLDFQNKKELYAIVCESLKYASVIQQILASTKILQSEKVLHNKQYLAQVLVHDLLFSKHGLKKQCSKKFKVRRVSFVTWKQQIISESRYNVQTPECILLYWFTLLFSF